jgi:hypothetical protein
MCSLHQFNGVLSERGLSCIIVLFVCLLWRGFSFRVATLKSAVAGQKEGEEKLAHVASVLYRIAGVAPSRCCTCKSSRTEHNALNDRPITRINAALSPPCRSGRSPPVGRLPAATRSRATAPSAAPGQSPWAPVCSSPQAPTMGLSPR